MFKGRFNKLMRGEIMWHDKDLPPDSGTYLCRFEDGEEGECIFPIGNGYFISSKKVVAWKDNECAIDRKEEKYNGNIFKINGKK